MNDSGVSGNSEIVQNTGNNGNVVTATIPTSVTITSEGPSAAQTSTTALSTLQDAITGRGSNSQTELIVITGSTGSGQSEAFVIDTLEEVVAASTNDGLGNVVISLADGSTLTVDKVTVTQFQEEWIVF
jgi:hypothetical protein